MKKIILLLTLSIAFTSTIFSQNPMEGIKPGDHPGGPMKKQETRPIRFGRTKQEHEEVDNILQGRRNGRTAIDPNADRLSWKIKRAREKVNERVKREVTGVKKTKWFND